MKLFQQLLVAPAALGFLAPLAVVNSPAANAAELNINGVSDYAASADQVTSVTQLLEKLHGRFSHQEKSTGKTCQRVQINGAICLCR